MVFVRRPVFVERRTRLCQTEQPRKSDVPLNRGGASPEFQTWLNSGDGTNMKSFVKTTAKCAAIGTTIGVVIGHLSPYLAVLWGNKLKDIEVALASIPHLYAFGLLLAPLFRLNSG